ncbi:MAG: LysM peptidoglycan-binding domain-containing protein [Phycisphaerales bacterium]|jgi:5'-nucleotidase / UDP-sugar diphosphatase|nr:LysM peptidoglycan-binding domain-containing protein [Phycisphaerales bacterium]
MKNFKYAALLALLLTSMMGGCNSKWNLFRKSDPAPTNPPLATGLTTMDGATLGAEPRPGTGTPVAVGTTDPGFTPTPITIDNTPTPPAPGTSIPATTSTYTIKKKDTLWSISTRYLGSGKRWQEIVDVNPGLSPQRLPIGKTINLPPK